MTAEAAAMHDDGINLSERTVRDLIRRHFPAWSDLSVREVRASGTVNAIFRIGPDLAGRFPLWRDDPKRLRDVLGRESRASAEFGLHSPFPSPEPLGVANADPASVYPLAWSVQTWVPGTVATADIQCDSIDFAQDLATLVAALRQVGTAGRRFEGDGRGGNLRES